ncbi:MAG: CBS domain-containing protein [archaeon]
MKIGIQAREIMNEDFPIVDSSLTLDKCVKSLGRNNEACIVVKQGYFHSILGYDDLLRGFMERKDNSAKISDISIEENFRVVGPDKDIIEIIELMNSNNTEFIVVKDSKKILGLITKKDIIDIEPLLFDSIKLKSPEQQLITLYH